MRVLFALVFFCLPSLAMALSCLPSNAAREFNSAVENKRTVALVSGTLSPLETNLVRKGFEDVSAEYSLLGTKLMGHGPDKAFDQKITVSSGCVLDQWCAPIISKPIEALFLLRRSEDGQYQLKLHACPSAIYNRYSSAHLQILRNCIARGFCRQSDLERLERR